MKKFLFIFLFFFLISNVYAINIIGGETKVFEVGEEFDEYKIVGNSESLDEIIFTKNGTSLIIKTSLLASPDTFTITFYRDGVEVGSSGGSSPDGSAQCYRLYKVSEWSECLDGSQTREVKKDYSVRCTLDKPAVPESVKECGVIEDTIDTETDTNQEQEEEKNNTFRNILIVIGIIIFVFAAIAVVEIMK